MARGKTARELFILVIILLQPRMRSKNITISSQSRRYEKKWYPGQDSNLQPTG
jgi:hypothetical protein